MGRYFWIDRDDSRSAKTPIDQASRKLPIILGPSNNHVTTKKLATTDLDRRMRKTNADLLIDD
jgi:hypothetical protein